MKEELLAWLEKLRQDELAMDGRYRNCGQLFRLPNGMPVAPEALSKWYRTWRAEHPEFEKIVFHGLRHSSATYQLIESGGNIKAVQGNTGHATTGILMDTYAHTQDKPRLELAEKLETDFYSQDIGSPKIRLCAGKRKSAGQHPDHPGRDAESCPADEPRAAA